MASVAQSSGDANASFVRKVAYIYSPSGDEEEDGGKTAPTPGRGGGRKPRRRRDGEQAASGRSPKKQRTASNDDPSKVADSSIPASNALESFPTLLQGRETPEAVALRQRLFATTWAELDGRIQTVLQRSNQATLDAVTDFIEQPSGEKLPAAFVILGPAATSDMLLFRQLAASSRAANSSEGRVRRMVRLRAAEAPNLRAALKAIVHEVTAGAAVDSEEKYLAYDLEAVYAAVRDRDARIIVTFEDSEAFDSGILADLLGYLHSWLDRIPFVLLFGVATSVDLFQARLPKAAAHRLAAAQFDVAPSSSVLDQLVRHAVAAADVPLRIGPNLLRSLAERQDEQVAGVSVFVNSLKYAYMCYFYANPLSVLLSPSASEFLEQQDYVDALRHLPSFRRHIESFLDDKDPSDEIVALLTDDAVFRETITRQAGVLRHWTRRLLRAVHLASASGAFADMSFTELYITALEGGGGHSTEDGTTTEDSLAATLITAIRRMSSAELVALARRLAEAVRAGDAELALAPAGEAKGGDNSSNSSPEDTTDTWQALAHELSKIAIDIEALQRKVEASNSQSRFRGGAGGSGATQLRSKYTAQSRVLRTTVVAQKVQLSRDSAALTAEDQAFTELVDRTVGLVVAEMDAEAAEGQTEKMEKMEKTESADTPQSSSLWLQEVWMYDARTPYRDVFIPRPVLVLERALSRPHDYLACKCCGGDETARKAERAGAGSIRPTLPPTAILYQLYREAGTLINVADLWAAFQMAVSSSSSSSSSGEAEEAGDSTEDGNGAEAEKRERRLLVQFYHGLAELKALGFVKTTRKKVDHVAKVKWL